MPHYAGLDVSQKTTAIRVVDERGKRIWRGVCATDPEAISARAPRHAGADARTGVETGPMTPWLVHGLRGAGLDVACLDARRVKAALQMRPKAPRQAPDGRPGHRTGGPRRCARKPACASASRWRSRCWSSVGTLA